MHTNIFVILIVAVVVIGGGWWYVNSDDSRQPTVTSREISVQQPETNVLPVPGSGVDEMVVVREFTVNGDNFSFSPTTMTVKKGDTVRVTFRNSTGTHDWVLDEFPGARTNVLGAGAEETIEFVADKAGTFEYYCSVGKHREMGMKGTLTVE